VQLDRLGLSISQISDYKLHIHLASALVAAFLLSCPFPFRATSSQGSQVESPALSLSIPLVLFRLGPTNGYLLKF
jgi:hypothetical protein